LPPFRAPAEAFALLACAANAHQNVENRPQAASKQAPSSDVSERSRPNPQAPFWSGLRFDKLDR
jgi:hypothetical protein